MLPQKDTHAVDARGNDPFGDDEDGDLMFGIGGMDGAAGNDAGLDGVHGGGGDAGHMNRELGREDEQEPDKAR